MALQGHPIRFQAGGVTLHLLAISGSLRAGSYNVCALEAARLLAPTDVRIERFSGLAGLPIFNPDQDGEAAPDSVRALRAKVGACDGLIIASPEYAHGVSGPLKNLLDWLVGSLDFSGKPVMLINASPRAFHAAAQLREILATMSARVVEEACVSLPLLKSDFDAASLAVDPALGAMLRNSLEKFAADVRADKIEAQGVAGASFNCPFCQREALQLIGENDFAFAVRDIRPVRPLHTLIIPKRHVVDILAATAAEREAVHTLADWCRNDIAKHDASVGGFNYGANMGAVAGQKVFHAHMHLIPRREGDTPPPPARQD